MGDAIPRNGSGVYTLPQAAFVAGTVISSAAVNSDFSDIATALTGSLPRDGQAGMTGHLTLVDGAINNPSLAFNNEDDTGFSRTGAGILSVSILGSQVGTFTSGGWTGAISGAGSLAVGMVCDFAGSIAPSLWLLCYGQNVSRTTYSRLFAALGTTYGSGDGSTTFGLPDLRGRATFGKDDMGGSAASRLTTTYFGASPIVLGNSGGSQSHTQSPSELVPHFHGASIFDPGHSHAYDRVNATDQKPSSGGSAPFVNVQTLQTGVSMTGVRVNSANGLDTTATTGGNFPFTIVNPGMIMNKIVYAGA